MKIKGIDFPNAINVLVQVTQDDIDTGVICDGQRCALAKAINRIAPIPYWIGVIQYWPKNFGTIELSWTLPDEALEFRRAFDSGMPTSPFSFWLNVLSKI